MGESSKKSAPNAGAASAVVSPSKSTINGKREAENEFEKQVSAKKQKRVVVAKNQKKEEKVQRKKESSSDSDDCFSDSKEDEKPAAKAAVASKKLPAKNGTLCTRAQKGKQAGISSSFGNSDDDSGLNDSKVAPAAGKSGPGATKKKAEASSDTESSSLDKDDLKTEVTTLPKKLPASGKKEPAKKVESSKASGSDYDSRTDEDNITASSRKLLAASAAVNNIPTKMVEASDDSSLDSGLDEDDGQKTHVTPSSKTLPTFVVSQKEKIENRDNSYDESSEGFDECNVSEEREEIEEKPSKTPQEDVKDEEMVDTASTEATGKEVPKMATTPNEQNAKSKKIFVGNLSYRVKRADLENLFKDCGEIVNVRFGIDRDGRFKGFGHVEFATEEAAQNALILNGSELLRRFVRIEIAREKGAYNPNSRNNSWRGFHASFGEDEPKTSATPKEQNATSKTLFVGNLSFSVERADLENLFKDCGEIVDIRFATDREGRFKGFGHVEFATEEAAQNALMLNGNELLRRSVRLDIAPERGAYSRHSNNRNDLYQKGGGGQPQTVFVNGFDTSLGENEAKMRAAPKEQNATSKTLFVGNLSYSVERADLEDLFKDCGEIVDIRFATDREGRFKGFGHVEFATGEAAQNALKLNGNELLRQYIRLDLAREKSAYSSNSRNRNDSFQQGGSGESQTVFVRGFDTSLGEAEIRTSLEEHFSSCGVISRISIARDYGTGSTKGYAWLDFMDVDGFNKALELDGTEVGGYVLSVEERRPRRYNQGGRGGGDQFGEWRGGGRWGQGRGYGSRWH